jgi:pimeloyl-ACP methyl ester carboxylesterase
MDGDIERLRADPTAIEHLGIAEIVDHYDQIIRGLDSPPIIMGHSFGGAFTEILLDRGLGAAGVAIDAAGVRGITKLPFSTLKSGFPVLKNPANIHRAVMLTSEEFHYAFTNTMTGEASAEAYERYAVPGPGRVLFQARLRTSTPARPTASTSERTTVRRCCSSPAGQTTSFPPRSTNRWPSTTAGRRRSRSTRSSPAARTSPSAKMAGRRSPTTH